MQHQAAETIVYPTVQFGPFGLRQDSFVTEQLLRLPAAGSRLQLMSAYFNLTREYAAALLEGRAAVEIVSAAREANGFYNSKGFSRFIPEAYALLQRQFAGAQSFGASSRPLCAMCSVSFVA